MKIIYILWVRDVAAALYYDKQPRARSIMGWVTALGQAPAGATIAERQAFAKITRTICYISSDYNYLVR